MSRNPLCPKFSIFRSTKWLPLQDAIDFRKGYSPGSEGEMIVAEQNSIVSDLDQLVGVDNL